MIPYTLIRSHRKTIAIYITRDAAVEVRSPMRTPRPEIDRIVASKEKWIAAHVAIQKRKKAEKEAFTIEYGGMALLCGKSFPILARDGKYAGFDGVCFFLPPGLPSGDIKRALIRIYKSTAKNVLTAKVGEHANRMGVTPSAVRIGSAGTRWGSCSNENSLNFSWKLIMGDEDVIDYVVVHELAHIIEHNHSRRFWAVVENFLPDFRARQARLKDLQRRLAGEDWE